MSAALLKFIFKLEPSCLQIFVFDQNIWEEDSYHTYRAPIRQFQPGVVTFKMTQGPDEVNNLAKDSEADMYDKSPLRYLQGKLVPLCYSFFTRKRHSVDLECLVLEQ
jgi:hypothetical protein